METPGALPQTPKYFRTREDADLRHVDPAGCMAAFAVFFGEFAKHRVCCRE
jgi:hypothetical protein